MRPSLGMGQSCSRAGQPRIAASKFDRSACGLRFSSAGVLNSFGGRLLFLRSIYIIRIRNEITTGHRACLHIMRSRCVRQYLAMFGQMNRAMMMARWNVCVCVRATRPFPGSSQSMRNCTVHKFARCRDANREGAYTKNQAFEPFRSGRASGNATTGGVLADCPTVMTPHQTYLFVFLLH